MSEPATREDAVTITVLIVFGILFVIILCLISHDAGYNSGNRGGFERCSNLRRGW